jgi:hypothetical protein
MVWFMEVVDGSLVTDGTGDKQIKACLWLKSNSITERDSIDYPIPLGCDVDRVKACGPPDCFTLKTKPRVKQAAAPKPAEVKQPKISVAPKTAKAADKVVISSSDSDSDAPISRGAVKLAKAKAAEAAALQRRVLETVKEMGKRYDDEPAAKRTKRMKFIDGAWHIPLK